MTDCGWCLICAVEVILPFMRSRMKQSLSGVWKAYVIHTMNGQSCAEREPKSLNQEVRRRLINLN